MIHPPCQSVLCQVTGPDGDIYYRSICPVCFEWRGHEKDLDRMPAQELTRARVTTEAAILAARETFMPEPPPPPKENLTVYPKAWYRKKGVRTL